MQDMYQSLDNKFELKIKGWYVSLCLAVHNLTFIWLEPGMEVQQIEKCEIHFVTGAGRELWEKG